VKETRQIVYEKNEVVMRKNTVWGGEKEGNGEKEERRGGLRGFASGIYDPGPRQGGFEGP